MIMNKIWIVCRDNEDVQAEELFYTDRVSAANAAIGRARKWINSNRQFINLRAVEDFNFDMTVKYIYVIDPGRQAEKDEARIPSGNPILMSWTIFSLKDGNPEQKD